MRVTRVNATAGFEVLTPVLLKIRVFWDVMLCVLDYGTTIISCRLYKPTLSDQA